MKGSIALAVAVMVIIAVPLASLVRAQEPAQPGQLYIYSGVLRSIDLKARTITVDESTLPQKFVVPTDAEIIVKDKPKADLSDLMVGDKIQVKYTDDSDTLVAHQISVLGLKTP